MPDHRDGRPSRDEEFTLSDGYITVTMESGRRFVIYFNPLNICLAESAS